jgi:PAS domain-containing protein
VALGLETGESLMTESRVRRNDGDFRWMLHRTVALVDDQRNVMRWFGSSIDIDDQKRIEAALRQATDDLRRSEFYERLNILQSRHPRSISDFRLASTVH